jgi:hypothetical protein
MQTNAECAPRARRTQEDAMQRPTRLEFVSVLIPALFLIVCLATA